MNEPAINAPTQDERDGMNWWNALTELERQRWLDRAWRHNERSAGRSYYSLADIPSPADAWAEFQRQRLASDATDSTVISRSTDSTISQQQRRR